MKKKNIKNENLALIDRMTRNERAEIKGGKVKVTGTVSVHYPPIKGEISISNRLQAKHM